MNPPQPVMRWDKPVLATLSRLHMRLEPALILAIIWQESSGNPWAWNPEPRYRWFMDVMTWRPFRPLTPAEIASEVPPIDFPTLIGDRDQEWWGQSASWGLMQVMGSAAREAGFREGYLTALCDPYVNLEFGTLHLWNYALQYGNRHIKDGLHRWNGGGNSHYADDVLDKKTTIENTPITAPV